MATTINSTCRIDQDIKAQSEAMFNEIGMSLTTAINVFLESHYVLEDLLLMFA